MAAVVKPSISDGSLTQERLPLLPVVAGIYGSSVRLRKQQVVVLPGRARVKAFRQLASAVGAQERHQLGRDHDDALALALRLAEDEAAALALRAVLRVGGAAFPAGRLRAHVRPLPAARRAALAVPMLDAVCRAGGTMLVLAAPMRVGAPMAPGETLELPPHLDDFLVEVDVLPPQSEHLTLP